MINLDIQIKLLVFSLIYGFLFSIMLDVLYPLIRYKQKYIKLFFTFVIVLFMAILYFIAIDKIGCIIFHMYGVIAIIIGFISYDLMISVIAKRIKK